MNPRKGQGAASPPPTAFGGGYEICISAGVLLCVGASVLSLMSDFLLPDFDIAYFGEPFCNMSMDASKQSRVKFVCIFMLLSDPTERIG